MPDTTPSPARPSLPWDPRRGPAPLPPEPEAVAPDDDLAVDLHGTRSRRRPPAYGRRTRRGTLNRFDRPPEPHDWRWVVGGIGRLLISVGLLIFGFVAYQLWGTGIATARAQHRLGNDFQEQLANATTLPSPTTTAPPTTVVETTVPGAAPTTAPVTVAPTVAPTVPPTDPATATTAPPAVIERPEVGSVLAEMDIPSIGISNLYVVEGVGLTQLADGPGHFPETSLPGQLGNAAIAGHRTTHSAPFLHLDKLHVGDQIVVTTLAGKYVYLVTGQEVVRPSEYDKVIPTVDGSVASLTLTTCTPAYSSTHRLVIHAVLDPTQSAPVTQPSAAASETTTPIVDPLADEASSIAATTPAPAETVSPVTTSPTTAVAGAGTSAAVVVPVTSAETVPPTTLPVISSAVVDDSQDVFGGGWFDDPGAFPQVAIWGVLLTVLAVGAYALSWRLRRNWVGLVVGAVPFLLALFFWYENVNRLLPPGL